MSKVALVWTILALVGFPSAGVLAASNQAPPPGSPPASSEQAKSVVGELTVVDPSHKTFSLEINDKVQEFILGPKATVVARGQNINFEELKVGQRLRVTYQMSGSTAAASHIEVVG